MFDEKEIEFMKLLGIETDFHNLPDDMLLRIEEMVSERLQVSGFDEDYGITDEGKICEAILDKL